jgi:hypothetical protein
MHRFNPRPIASLIVLFAVEVYIALYVRDAWLRPYGGDLLAVVLVYACARLWLVAEAWRLALGSFAVGALVELVQYLELLGRLGLSHHPVLSVVVGTTFQWGDLLAYALGALAAWALDRWTPLLTARRNVARS